MDYTVEYFSVEERERFSFCRLPKSLIENPGFRSLSSDAKLLYSVMLDRMELSRGNGWVDTEGRVFICYKVSEVEELLGCSKPTAIKRLEELDDEKGLGLIERKHQRLCKPDIIYVKKIVELTRKEGEAMKKDEVKADLYEEPGRTPIAVPEEKIFSEPTGVMETVEGTDLESDMEGVISGTTGLFQGRTSPPDNGPATIPELRKAGVKSLYPRGSMDFTSGGQRALPLEVKNPDPNKTENNYTKSNEIYSLHFRNPYSTRDMPHENETGKEEKDGRTSGDDYDQVREKVRENISFDALLIDDPQNRESYEEYVELITEILCSKKKSIRIAGNEHPAEYVKERFRQLDRGAIEMVENGISENITKVRNYKQYVLASLFNATALKSLNIRIRVNHDMAEYARQKMI